MVIFNVTFLSSRQFSAGSHETKKQMTLLLIISAALILCVACDAVLILETCSTKKNIAATYWFTYREEGEKRNYHIWLISLRLQRSSEKQSGLSVKQTQQWRQRLQTKAVRFDFNSQRKQTSPLIKLPSKINNTVPEMKRHIVCRHRTISLSPRGKKSSAFYLRLWGIRADWGFHVRPVDSSSTASHSLDVTAAQDAPKWVTRRIWAGFNLTGWTILHWLQLWPVTDLAMNLTN